MPSFFLTTSLQDSQVLTAAQTGFVAESVALFTLGTSAVSMTGGARLDVFGTVGSNSVQALSIALPTDDVFVTVGANGTLFSNLNAAIRGTLTDQFHLSNAGLISGGTEAIEVTAAFAGGTTSDFHIVNSGSIQSNGNLATHNTLEFDQPVGALVNIANAGLILNGGAGGGISVVGGRLDLTNSGTIQTRPITSAVSADLGNDTVTNTGTIIGAVVLNDGNDEVTNHGTISGNVLLGNGSDRLTNTATITGSVNLADSLNTGAISDTVINAGLIVGDVQLGNGNDTYVNEGGRVEGLIFGGQGDDDYFVDRGDLVISDTGGLDQVFSTADFTLSTGLEELRLTGPAGLRGTGNSGQNTIIGGSGDDTLRGEEGDDVLQGFYGDDRVFGGQGNDSLLAFGDDDVLKGGAGNDRLQVVDGDATLDGGRGIDTVWLGFVGTVPAVVDLAAGTGFFGEIATMVITRAENVLGTDGSDTLTGDGGDNLLEGANSGDSLSGGGGNDTLAGGSGADTMAGGSGNDVFAFASTADSGAAAADLVTDFNRTRDRFDLSAIDAAIGGAYDAFAFLGSSAFTGGSAGQVRVVIDAGANLTTVEVRLAGSVANDMVVMLSGQINLTADNFVL